MWFKLNTTFTQSLGTLSTLSNSWSITRNLTNFSTTSTTTSVTKDGSYSATFTLNSGCTYSSHSVTMGGSTITDGVTLNSAKDTLTVSISKVTGAVVITAVATGASSGGSSSGGNLPSGNTEFPLRSVGVGVTSEGTGRAASSQTRLSNASTTEKLGILVPSEGTITLYGLTSGTYPLRFDYVYGTANVVNPASGSTTPIEGLLGTASNYVSSNYFPCNVDGADSYSITNTYGQDCYFWFGFAGLTKAEKITAEINTYNITYYIS